jgi:hypothetical protein
MTTLSPQKVIVYTVSSIPPAATHAELILTDPQEFHDTLPSTLTHLILQSQGTVGQVNQIFAKALPPTLTWLTTGNKFNQSVDKLPPTLGLLKQQTSW